jgi:hypothetical protein
MFDFILSFFFGINIAGGGTGSDTNVTGHGTG